MWIQCWQSEGQCKQTKFVCRREYRESCAKDESFSMSIGLSGAHNRHCQIYFFLEVGTP